MKKCLVIPFILISLMMIPKTTHASDYIESVKNYSKDTLINRYQNDYDYYVLASDASFERSFAFNAPGTTTSTGDDFRLCFFNKDDGIRVESFIIRVSKCQKQFDLRIVNSVTSSSVNTSLSVSDVTENDWPIYGKYILTNYFDKEDSSSSTGGVSSKIDIEELKPYFILVSFFICLCFLGIVWRRR